MVSGSAFKPRVAQLRDASARVDRSSLWEHKILMDDTPVSDFKLSTGYKLRPN